MSWEDHWLWNLAPLGLVKFVARHKGYTLPVIFDHKRAGPPFHCACIGGVLIRSFQKRSPPHAAQKIQAE